MSKRRTFYEKLFKEHTLRNLQRKAGELGFDVTPMASTAFGFLEAAYSCCDLGHSPPQGPSNGEVLRFWL